MEIDREGTEPFETSFVDQPLLLFTRFGILDCLNSRKGIRFVTVPT